MHVILGAGGTIGRNLLKILKENKESYRLVSRTSHGYSENWQAANLLNKHEADAAVKGARYAYLTAGLTYNTQIWQKEWPVIMQNVIDACSKHDVKLIFFDNVYAYGQVNGDMTEETPYNPCSKKGELRARIADMLMHEIKSNTVKGLIARSADFYGPDTPLSMLNIMVLDRQRVKQKAQWVSTGDKLHSFTYTPDAALGCYMLAKENEAYGKIWHLPTFKEALSVRQIAEIGSTFINGKEGLTVFPAWAFKMLGLFNPVVKESIEMLYQFEHDYLFSSKKFEEKFRFLPTSYKRGIVNTLTHS